MDDHLPGKNRYIRFVVGFALLLVTGGGLLSIQPWPAVAAPTDLFFSEYVEGSGHNQALEIFNGTPNPVDLAPYDIQLFENGLPTPSRTITLSGTIPPGGVYVIANASADPPVLITADRLESGALFNGNDAIVLRRLGSPLDVIGQVGFDPGIEWGSGETSTQNNTLRRHPTIQTGHPETSTPFDPALEWTGWPENTFDDLGRHTFIPLTQPTPGDIVINEVAWSGTQAAGSDEWLELLNLTPYTLTLNNTFITSTNGLSLALHYHIMLPHGYFLIERTDDQAVSDVAADLATSFQGGLANEGEALFLSTAGVRLDTANGDGGPWPGGSGSPGYHSMERIDPTLPDTDDNWRSHNGIDRQGHDADNQPINGTPKQPNSPPLPPPTVILIGEFLYDGLTPSTEGDEFVELCNPASETADLSGYKVGDGESLYQLPFGFQLVGGDCLVAAKNADQFQARFGSVPDFELITTGSGYTDRPDVPNLAAWSGGGWSLANDGDELMVLGPGDEVLDAVAYGSGDYSTLGLEAAASAPAPYSLQRIWPLDTDSMAHDFARQEPNPGLLTPLPDPFPDAPAPVALPGGMSVYWGHLHGHTSYADGPAPPYYTLALARQAGLHFSALTDPARQLSAARWNASQAQADQATVPGQFVALPGLEWSTDTGGHVNLFNVDSPLTPTDLPALYSWLAAHPTVIAQLNQADRSTGFDFSFDAGAAPMVTLAEIGPDDPAFARHNSAGWQVAPTHSGLQHPHQQLDTSARTGLLAPALTQADLLAAMRARRAFATTDPNLALALQVGETWMGGTLTTPGYLPLAAYFADPDPEPLTLSLYDRDQLLTSLPFDSSTGQWSTTVEVLPGHYLWLKAVQADGDTAYSAPVWCEGQIPLITLYINEILPAPKDWDWDGSGQANRDDEWLELFNPQAQPVSLSDWQVADASNTYRLPLGTSIPAGGFITFYRVQTGLALNNNGDTVTLLNPDGVVVDTVTYDHTPGDDESHCRLPDGGVRWSDDCGPSPNGANWEKEPDGPLEQSIYRTRQLTHNAWVRVKGRVTAPPGPLGTRIMYIQDESGGIAVYLPQEHGLYFNLGDKVEVEGKLRSYYEELQIRVKERGDVSFIEAGQPPSPLPIATTSLLEPYEGLLVRLQGQAVAFKDYTTFWVDDGTDPAKIYIRRTTGIHKPYMAGGTPVTAIGIVSQYSRGTPSREDYRLLPRYQADLVLPAPPPLPTPWPSILPETGSF